MITKYVKIVCLVTTFEQNKKNKNIFGNKFFIRIYHTTFSISTLLPQPTCKPSTFFQRRNISSNNALIVNKKIKNTNMLSFKKVVGVVFITGVSGVKINSAKQVNPGVSSPTYGSIGHSDGEEEKTRDRGDSKLTWNDEVKNIGTCFFVF